MMKDIGSSPRVRVWRQSTRPGRTWSPSALCLGLWLVLTLALVVRDSGAVSSSFSLGVGSFNVHHLSLAKYDANVEVYAAIVGVQKIYLLQEVLNTSVGAALVNNLNQQPKYATKKPFRSVSSELLGPDTTDKQAYTFIYRNDFVTAERTYQYPIRNYTEFYRPPFSVKFYSPQLGSFICTAMHTSSKRVVAELRALDNAVQAIQTYMESYDILIMGDMNVGCGNVPATDWSTIALFVSNRYKWFVSPTVQTSLLSSACSDDRFVASSSLAQRIPESSVQVFHFDTFYSLTHAQALNVSTHYPITLDIIQPEPSLSQPSQTLITKNQLLAKYSKDGVSLGCGYITTTLQGAVTDGSGLEENYRNNLDCIWIILAPVNHSITIRVAYKFENFYEDRLDIRDGYEVTSLLLARLQNEGDGAVSTTGNVLLLNFITDSSGTGPGFVATFTSTPLCGGMLTELQGSIESPVNEYTQEYPSNALCIWNINVPLGMVIKLSFERFQVEPDEKCAADYVIIVDGQATEFTVNNATLQERGLALSQNAATGTRLCGLVLPQPFTSSSSQIGVGFKSDYTDGAPGFRLTYTAFNHSSCQGGFRFSGLHGLFEDDSGPSVRYAANTNCSYYITVPTAHIISLKFLSLDIEPAPGCLFDYLNIWDPDTGRLLRRVCGSAALPIVTPGNRVRLQLVSDSSLEFTGFEVSYRACEICPAGMYAVEPCFDRQRGFCAKCTQCAADEVLVGTCTAVSDTVCGKNSFPSSELSPVHCSAEQYRCRSGRCVAHAVLCDGQAQCPDGDDEQFCGCEQITNFRCGNRKCIPEFLRCNGQDNCLDNSDEVLCTCNVESEFTCSLGQNITECIPLGWRCDGQVDCTNGVDEQGCLEYEGIDQCSTDHLAAYSVLPSARLASVSWLRRCFDSIALKPSVKNLTLSIIRDGVLNRYAYSDLLRDSRNTDSSLRNSQNYSVYDFSVDIQAELNRIEATNYRTSYAFHTDLMTLMSRFDDAHTTYISPFSSISLLLPFVFGSAINNREQRLTIDGVHLATFPAYYELHRGPPFINFDKYGTVFPSVLGMGSQHLVDRVNGVPALQWARQLADRGGLYKSAGVRFNAFLASPAFDLGRYPLPENDTIDMTFGDNTAIHLKYTALINLPDGITLRSLLTTQYQVKELAKIAEEQRLFRQFLRSYSDDNHVPSSLLAGLPASSRRRYRRSSSPVLSKVLELELSATSALSSFYDSEACVVKMTTFQPNISITAFLEFFNDVSRLARRKKSSTLLLDVTGNPGGYIAFANALLGFLEPGWLSSPLTTICPPLDVRVGAYLEKISAALTASRIQLARPQTSNQALHYIMLVNETINDGMLLSALPSLTQKLGDLYRNASLAESDASRSRLVADFFEREVFAPLETALLRTMQLPVNMSTGERLSLAQLVDTAVMRRRGGVTGKYTQKFASGQGCLDVLSDASVRALLPREAPFKDVLILTDGQCGSACSQFVSTLQLAGKATVISYGGYAGEPMDSSSFAGGNVQFWNREFWEPALLQAIWSKLLLGTAEQTAESFGFNAPLPLPSPAQTSFDLTEAYMRELGPNSLPREWYLIPADIRMSMWTSGTNSWPLQSSQQVALLNLYRHTLAQFRAGRTGLPVYQPCHFQTRCRPHGNSVWSHTSIVAVNVSLFEDQLSLYNNSDCSLPGLELQVVRTASFKDLGPNALSPTTLYASNVRMFSMDTHRTTVTAYSQKWVAALNKACPCHNATPAATWVSGEGISLRPGTCAKGKCNIAPINFNMLYGNYVIQDVSHIYLSQQVDSRQLGAEQPIRSEGVFVLDTVYEMCFPVIFQPTNAPPATLPNQEGEVRAAATYSHNWRRFEIYIAGEWVPMCGDHWDDKDGVVYCRQKSKGKGKMELVTNKVTSSLLLLNASRAEVAPSVSFNCSGVEKRLLQCRLPHPGTCTDDLIMIVCAPVPSSPSASHRAVDYGVGISLGVAAVCLVLVVVFAVRRARRKATKFSSSDLASMQLGQPRSWWHWTPLNETDGDENEDFTYSDQVNYAES